jgi:FMN phosphatase YigB (HAD superfamily)
MVDTAFEQGWQVVIATNPLFPRRAIEQRLSWAGLPLDRYPFQLIASYESFHFTKPHPAYFAEVLANLGWPTHTVAMVGNSLADDLIPAAELGIQFCLPIHRPTPRYAAVPQPKRQPERGTPGWFSCC